MKNQGTFYGKAVKTQFNTFLNADDDILNAFFNFGTSVEIPENLIIQIERFVCMLYSKKNQKSIKGYWTHFHFLAFFSLCYYIILANLIYLRLYRNTLFNVWQWQRRESITTHLRNTHPTYVEGILSITCIQIVNSIGPNYSISDQLSLGNNITLHKYESNEVLTIPITGCY